MSRYPARILWGMAVLMQVAAIYGMISGRETILREGRAFRFRTAPVDPYDAFRGRYVALAVEARSAPWPAAEQKPARGRTIYVTLSEDGEGFARLEQAYGAPPSTGAYLRVRAGWSRDSDQVDVVMPVDRYYLPEKEARRAEQLYREHNRPGQQDAFVVLKVRRGEAVAEDLVVGGRSIHEWMRAEEPPVEAASPSTPH